MTVYTRLRLFGASLAALAVAFPATAQTSPAEQTPGGEGEVDQGVIIVTGTRTTGLRAADSPAPIEVVDAAALTRTGVGDVTSGLSATIPSFTSQAFGGDAGNLKLSARLRGLSSNHALILVNGKRRHGASSLTVQQTGGFVGAASPDLAFIPAASIERIEVLTDGAAAQYGTDAIAGVINIILKNASHGGSASVSGGAYGEGDGETYSATANAGFGNEAVWLNLTGEYRYHDYSDRGGPDRRVYTAANLANPALPLLPGYPHLNKIFGDARYKLANVAANAGAQLSEQVELYANGTFSYRYGVANQNYRFPSISPIVWPKGFTPKISSKQYDYQGTAGLRGDIADVWHWDLSTTYGRDDNRMGSIDTVNNSLVAATGTSKTDFLAGKFIASQWTSNLDIRREFDAGLASPVSVAFGGEYRHETFEIVQGEAAALFGGGIQAYPGFAPTDAGKHSRNAWSAYVDVALSPVEKLQLDVAGRYEHYSDFGSALVGKLTTRYDFTDSFALRGTISTGFRAPTLAEEFYSATTISPTTAGVRLPPNNSAAALLGIDPLDSEKSTNLSLGAVFTPSSRFSATLDAYQIVIDDRIVSTGLIYGKQNNVIRSPAVTAAIVANGNNLDPTVVTTSISTFVNGADTRTRGVELVLNYTTPVGGSSIDWSLGANYNKTKVRKIAAPSAQIAASNQKYLDANAISFIETASPRYKVTLGTLFKGNDWLINLRNTLYGKSYVFTDGGNTGHYVKNSIGTKVITDLDISYDVSRALRVTVGANNLFDIRPDKIDPVTYAESLAVGGNGVATRQSFGPFGINGGYYYAKLTVRF